MNRLRTGVVGLTSLVCCILLAVLGPDMPDQAAKTLLKFLLLGLAPLLALIWQGGSLRLGRRRQGRRKRRALAVAVSKVWRWPSPALWIWRPSAAP